MINAVFVYLGCSDKDHRLDDLETAGEGPLLSHRLLVLSLHMAGPRELPGVSVERYSFLS